jgi:transcriptional regulator with XRE-family HTH domain
LGLEKISKFRELKKMTLKELSIKSGIPISTIKKISSGVTTNPNLETVQAIAKALDCSLDDFDDNAKEKNNYFLYEDEKMAIEKYRQLDIFGKTAVNNTLDTEIKRIKAQNNKDYLMPIAAHERKGATEEGKKHDLEILKECYKKYGGNDND